MDILGGACVVCGNTDVRVLEFDHINNNGKQHRERIWGNVGGGGTGTPFWVVAYPEEANEELQLLCANCHAIKTHGKFLWRENSKYA